MLIVAHNVEVKYPRGNEIYSQLIDAGLVSSQAFVNDAEITSPCGRCETITG